MSLVKESKLITHLGLPFQNGKGLDRIPIKNSKQENRGGILRRIGNRGVRGREVRQDYRISTKWSHENLPLKTQTETRSPQQRTIMRNFSVSGAQVGIENSINQSADMCHVICDVLFPNCVNTDIFKSPKDVVLKLVWATSYCFGTKGFANIGLLTCLKKKVEQIIWRGGMGQSKNSNNLCYSVKKTFAFSLNFFVK